MAFGRDVAAAELRVPDPLMSRVHFRIAFDSRVQAFRLVDARSRNGTFQNSEKIDSRALSAGDVVRAGDTVFVFERSDVMSVSKARAASAAASPFPILVVGETGAGKERLAHAIHEQSGRTGAFVPVNCAVLNSELIGSELFGHCKGAFSGAAMARDGMILRANSGTLLLDEIGDLPLQQQPALLRMLQEGTVRPVGADREIPVDVRIIAATNIDLEQAIQRGTFREDLYARLAQLIIRVPSLRERRADILPTMQEFAQKSQRSLALDADVAEAMLLWNWPRNVRELQAFTRSWLVFSTADRLTLGDLEQVAPPMAKAICERNEPEASLRDPSRRSSPPVSREELKALLAQNSGNIVLLSRALAVHRTQVYRWLQSYALDPEEFR